MSISDNPLAKLLHEQRTLLGLAHCYAAEGILETMAAGWDFIWVDGQHGNFTWIDALRAVRTAAGLGLETLLRVPTHDAGLLGLYADTGAAAIMIPMVDTASMAEEIVRALRFPPRGNRSFGGRRVIDVHGRDYYRTREPLVVAQIESKAGLEQVDRIGAVEGIDVLFFGAEDMKLHLGIPLSTPRGDSPELLDAQRATAEAARAAGKWAGYSAADASDIKMAAAMGYQMIIGGADVRFLRAGSRQALEEGRRILAEAGQQRM